MPMYMDIHEIQGVNPEDVAKAHLADVKIQDKYGVEYIKYWLNESRGKIFCLCNAPSAEAADRVHREAHGLPASKIIEVEPDVAQGFLGGTDVNPAAPRSCPAAAPAIATPAFAPFSSPTSSTPRRSRSGSATRRR